MNLRLKLAEYCLSKSGKEREDRRFANWKQIKRLQLLYCANAAQQAAFTPLLSELRKIQDFCKQDGIHVFFVMYSDMPLPSSGLDDVLSVCRKDRNTFTLKPRKSMLSEFGGYDADLLINLSAETMYPLEFFASASSARFKASALRQPQGARYDFIMDTLGGNNSPLTVFKAVRHYMEIIEAG